MLSLIIIIITGIAFALCIGAFVVQIVSSLNFRNRTAVPRSYIEGMMTGAAYPMLIVSISLLFVQFVTFIAFPIETEFFTVVRLTLYLLSLVSFVFFRACTPDVMALWFGKEHIYESGRPGGAFTYDRITSIYSTPKKVNPRDNCRVTLTVYGKKFLGHRKKYVCRMTGRDYAAIFYKRKAVYSADLEQPETASHRFCTSVLPLTYLLIVVCIIFLSVGTGIFNPRFYDSSDTPLTAENKTLVKISDIAMAEGTDTLFVLYDRVGIINAYSGDGEYKYTLSVPKHSFSRAEINVLGSASADSPMYGSIVSGNIYLLYKSNEDCLLFNTATGELAWKGSGAETVKNGAYIKGDRTYDFNDYSVFYTDEGNTVTVYDVPDHFAVFQPHIYWIVLCAAIASVFILRRIIRPATDVEGEDEDVIYDDDELDSPSSPDEEDEEDEEDVITEEYDGESEETEEEPAEEQLSAKERRKAEKKARKEAKKQARKQK